MKLSMKASLLSALILLVACLAALSCAAGGPPGDRPGVLSKREVLSLSDGTFQLEGRRFAEISFNKFDLFWALYCERLNHHALDETNRMVRAQDNALGNLRKLGFRTIRIFAFPWGENAAPKVQDPESLRTIFEALDKTVELCERNHIGIIWMLGCIQFTDDTVQMRELCANRESPNRKALAAYMRQVIDRYKNSPAVLMWEISNEVTLGADIGIDGVFDGKRMPTLKQVAVFYDDMAKLIKERDPLRLVNNGGSNPRGSQWNLYQKNGWKADTSEEQYKCFDLLFGNSAVDVIDIHFYADNKGGVRIAGADGREKIIGMSDYMSYAARLRKPLMVGELGCSAFPPENKQVWVETPGYPTSFTDARTALPWINKVLNDVVNSGVQLSYWWSYQSDREMDQVEGGVLSLEKTPEIVLAIAEANQRLKRKLGIMGSAHGPGPAK